MKRNFFIGLGLILMFLLVPITTLEKNTKITTSTTEFTGTKYTEMGSANFSVSLTFNVVNKTIHTDYPIWGNISVYYINYSLKIQKLNNESIFIKWITFNLGTNTTCEINYNSIPCVVTAGLSKDNYTINSLDNKLLNFQNLTKISYPSRLIVNTIDITFLVKINNYNYLYGVDFPIDNFDSLIQNKTNSEIMTSSSSSSQITKSNQPSTNAITSKTTNSLSSFTAISFIGVLEFFFLYKSKKERKK